MPAPRGAAAALAVTSSHSRVLHIFPAKDLRLTRSHERCDTRAATASSPSLGTAEQRTCRREEHRAVSGRSATSPWFSSFHNSRRFGPVAIENLPVQVCRVLSCHWSRCLAVRPKEAARPGEQIRWCFLPPPREKKINSVRLTVWGSEGFYQHSRSCASSCCLLLPAGARC